MVFFRKSKREADIALFIAKPTTGSGKSGFALPGERARIVSDAGAGR
jgi:hypothetical protein